MCWGTGLRAGIRLCEHTEDKLLLTCDQRARYCISQGVFRKDLCLGHLPVAIGSLTGTDGFPVMIQRVRAVNLPGLRKLARR